jgi:hypothetical protein
MMKKFILSLALSFGLGLVLGTSQAQACEEQIAVEDCGTHVPNVDYSGGGKVVKTVKATACFTSQTGYDITLKNGQYRFVAAFVYQNERSHERIKDVRGRVAKRGDRVCWTHNVAPGAHMAVWVTCQTPDGQPYEGWVAVRVTKAGTYEMQFRPDWNWEPKWL